MGGKRDLEKALARAFQMETKDARETAKVVHEAFAGEPEVNDEDLEKDVRSLFYQLEKEQLLQVRRTEYKLDGQVRRAYFWRLGRLNDGDPGGAERSLTKEELETTRLYWQLPQELWARRPTARPQGT